MGALKPEQNHKRRRSSWSRISLARLMLAVGFLAATAAAAAEQTIQELDNTIQSAAFSRLAPLPKTGIIYNVTLDSGWSNSSSSTSPSPPPLRIQAVRLRSGSLRRHGLVLNEFNIPVQCLVETTSKYVVLVYRDFGSRYPGWSASRGGFTLVAPVLGIKAYEGNDLSNPSPQELSVFSGPSAITARIPLLGISGRRLSPSCAFFDKDGSLRLTSIASSPNVCVLSQLVDSSLAVASSSLPPAPAPAPAPAPVPAPEVRDLSPAQVAAPLSSIVLSPPSPRKSGHRISKAWRLGLGVGVGGVGLAAVVAVAIVAVIRLRRRARFARMELCAENSESLQTALISGSRAPAAAGTRTRPVLENDYISP